MLKVQRVEHAQCTNSLLLVNVPLQDCLSQVPNLRMGHGIPPDCLTYFFYSDTKTPILIATDLHATTGNKNLFFFSGAVGVGC